jgi:hypothetical protein
MKVLRPKIGEITQGTIFNCATADRYRGKKVHGLAITARCDVANDKYPVLNYLPIVTLFDWMHCDGVEILLANAIKSATGSFASILKQADIATSVLTAVSRQEVVRSFFDMADATPARKKLSGKAHEQADLLDRLEAVDLGEVEDRNWFLRSFKKECGSLVKDLITNKVLSFYYLPSVTDSNDGNGYVILLRESAFLPRSVAKEVAGGVERPVNGNSPLTAHLSFDEDDFAMPVGKVPSPHIEHVLQTFSYMFGRIGLEDYAPDFIAKVCEMEFEVKGAGAL